MLTFLFTASLLLFAFSLGYYLFLRQGPALNLRRRVLLLGIVGTFLLPFCPSPSVPEAFTTTPVHVEEFTNWVGEESTLDEGAELGLGALAMRSEPEFVTETYAMLLFKELRVILLVYLLGVLLFLGKVIIGLVRLYRLHRASRSSGTPNLRLLERDGDAFTFGNTVYLSESVFYASDADVILEHEQTHAREWHTVDALLAEVMRAFLWFHPLAWWVRDQVQVNLEYLADQGVLRAGYDKRSYQLSLVAHQQGTDMRTSLLPQFAAKGIKRRIKMMAFRAGPQVRSLLMSGVIVFVCFALFAVTNGRAQAMVTVWMSTERPAPVETKFSSLFDGVAKEYNIYFRRLPTVGELEALRQPLEGFYNKDLFVYQSCSDPEGTLTFAYGMAVANNHDEVKLKLGERSAQHHRFQVRKDGKGNTYSSTFRPAELPTDAPDEDIVINVDGTWITISSRPDQPFTPDNLTYSPVGAQIRCQLGLAPGDLGNVSLSFIGTTTSAAPNGDILTFAKDFVYEISPNLPRTFYYEHREISETEFFDRSEDKGMLLTVGALQDTGDGRDNVVARLDPVVVR